MYVAFWLDPTAEDPNKRVVFCQPFAKKPTTAWAILRSAVREKKTGGILAGPEEQLRTCVESIDQKDQGWPDDPDRMVSQITKLAQTCECTVVFRQNVEPDGVRQHAAVWANLIAGTPILETEAPTRSVVRVPLSGRHNDISNAMAAADCLGWTVEGDTAWTNVGRTRLSIQRFRTIETRAALEIEYPAVVAAYATTKQNSAGLSQEVKFGFEKFEDLFDTMLGPTSKRYKFVLLIKERTNSILFLGTKSATTARQAIEQYMDHLQDRPSSDEPRSSQPDKDSEPDLVEEIATPTAGNCRFWKL